MTGFISPPQFGACFRQKRANLQSIAGEANHPGADQEFRTNDQWAYAAFH
jgi:hypothetical protein